MTKPAKPAKVLELTMDTDATPEALWKALTEAPGLANWFAPEASTSGSGVGSTVTVSWGGGMEFTTPIGVWEPGRHLQWVSEDIMGPGTKLVTDWHIATEAGKTRLRMVQSGFGEFDGWDDFFAGTDAGWRYFLYNLRQYLERHSGKTRRMISRRIPVGISRRDAWRKALEPLNLRLDGGAPLEAVKELEVDGRAVGLRIPALGDALLMIELEGCSPDSFNIGMWLSVYDAAMARRIEASAERAFDRMAEAVKAPT